MSRHRSFAVPTLLESLMNQAATTKSVRGLREKNVAQQTYPKPAYPTLESKEDIKRKRKRNDGVEIEVIRNQ